jgi:hypothetical protein
MVTRCTLQRNFVAAALVVVVALVLLALVVLLVVVLFSPLFRHFEQGEKGQLMMMSRLSTTSRKHRLQYRRPPTAIARSMSHWLMKMC